MNVLSPSQDMPRSSVMRSRAWGTLALGVLGICLGVAAAITSSAPIAVAAGVCAAAASCLAAAAALLPMLEARDSEELKTQIESLTSAKPANMADYTAFGGAPGDTVIDKLTGLPDRRYFEVAVDGRVAAARRHLWPVSIVLLQCGFDDEEVHPEIRDRSLESFAKLMRQTLREADIACRLDDDRFGLILEDTSEEGGVWTAERLQIALSHDASAIKRLVAGVAAYPTHGLFAKDVMVRAQAALKRANSTPVGHGLGQVEVAHTDLG